MHGWQTLAELTALRLSIVAGQEGQAIRIPWLVMEELRGSQERYFQQAADRLETGIRDVTRVFDEQEDFGYDPEPDVDGQLSSWSSRLLQFAEIIEPVPEDMVEGFRRDPQDRTSEGTRSRQSPVAVDVTRPSGSQSRGITPHATMRATAAAL
jgi:hypothetical protein